jgi:hypothetical protein
MFPLFRQVGANTTFPTKCNCTLLTLEELSDKTHDCNMFRFLSGFMFLAAPAEESGAYVLGLTLGKLRGNLGLLNENSHHAMFAASTFGRHSPLAHVITSPEFMADAYEFCRVGTVTCSILMFATYDLTPSNWAVNKQFTLMQNGACSDSISPTDEQWYVCFS